MVMLSETVISFQQISKAPCMIPVHKSIMPLGDTLGCNTLRVNVLKRMEPQKPSASVSKCLQFAIGRCHDCQGFNTAATFSEGEVESGELPSDGMRLIKEALSGGDTCDELNLCINQRHDNWKSGESCVNGVARLAMMTVSRPSNRDFLTNCRGRCVLQANKMVICQGYYCAHSQVAA